MENEDCYLEPETFVAIGTPALGVLATGVILAVGIWKGTTKYHIQYMGGNKLEENWFHEKWVNPMEAEFQVMGVVRGRISTEARQQFNTVLVKQEKSNA